MPKNLKFVRDISWDEVFLQWKEREGKDPTWIKVATETKGWPNWESWRGFSAAQFGAQNRKWKLYEVLDPNEQLPNFIIGPFQGWQKHFDASCKEWTEHTFADLAQQKPEVLSGNSKIAGIMRNFPAQTTLIGIYLKSNGKIVCYEGCHRCAAVTLAKSLGVPINFAVNPTIAITEFSPEDEKLFEKILHRGSGKNIRE